MQPTTLRYGLLKRMVAVYSTANRIDMHHMCNAC